MLRAEDRLKEAVFFLNKLKSTNGEGEEFRYYLSAFTSASRSITLVLQADLRSEFGERFNEWWEQIKEDIPVSPISFETIRLLRNVLQKEGRKLLHVYHFVHENEGIVVEKIVDLFDEGAGTMKISFTDLPTISLNPPITFTIDEANENHNKRMIEDLNRRVMDEIKQFAFAKIVSAANSLNEFNMSHAGFKVSEGELYNFETLVSGFEIYLTSMQKLLDEASLLFNNEP